MKAGAKANLQISDWGKLDYGRAFCQQKELVRNRIEGSYCDHLVFAEHPPVVTIGRSGGITDLCVDQETLRSQDVALHKTDRGGKATFHGPGQMVVYPVLKLRDQDLHAYLHKLLQITAEVIESYGLKTKFKQGQPGIWVSDAKIASVGIAVRKQVAYHGIALNVHIDTRWFDLIIPCGRPGEKITSLKRELEIPPEMSQVKKRFVKVFCRTLHYSAFRLNADEAHPKQIERHPQWLVRSAPDLKAVDRMETRLGKLHLATVCQSAHCPNLGECFGRGTAAFMILGDRCTRKCRFCAVEKDAPKPVDENEPVRVARAVQLLGLNHAVVTSVTRDDLPDGGARQFVRTIRQIRKTCKDTCVEVLVPDFNGAINALQNVCESRPDVFNHNIETVARLYDKIRPIAKYQRSLSILSYAFGQGLWVKSGLMLGLGETADEIKKTLLDLKHTGCEALTLGQYLAPSKDHAPVARYVPPEEFEMWAETARNMGFKAVASGPLVRSSYRADAMRVETERLPKNCNDRGLNLWKPKDLLLKSDPAQICTVKTSPKPHVGL
ncbi:lipoyl synthase [Desulfococcaceae bacterium HSG9]|nr:lipoyl synthase [Desulfococcaceae bacterium HSG9]